MYLLIAIIKWRLRIVIRNACKIQHVLFHAIQTQEPGHKRNIYLAKAVGKRSKWKNAYGCHIEYEDGGSIDIEESFGLKLVLKKVLKIEFLPLLTRLQEEEKREIIEHVSNEVEKYFAKVTCEEL